MKLLLVLSVVVVVSSNPASQHKGFVSLISSLSEDYKDDMEDILHSEQVYVDALNRKEEAFYSDVELLIGEEKELEEEPVNEDEEEEDSAEPDISDLPEELDNRARGIMHKPFYQGYCSSCGWVSGTQTIEARVAFVSENYIPYSVQNFMNCGRPERPCAGAQPYRVNTMVMKKGMAVPQREIPYSRQRCLKEEGGKAACEAKCGLNHPDKFSNALYDQFVFVAGTKAAHSEAQLIAALQGGPVTTCFGIKSVEKGERCGPGCVHANSIVGYNKEKFIIQDSYGKKWGKHKDGSWMTSKTSICAKSVIKKAYYPNIMYDYDRANAYFTAVEGGVKKEELKFVDKEKYGITTNTTKNWGTAKNKCAFLGSACKGVVQLSPTFNTTEVELVADFGAGSGGDLPAFKKVQMVIYLRHEGSGKYLGIKKSRKGLQVIAVQRGKAAPFFTSYARFIPFNFPKYHLVNNKLVQIVGGLGDIDPLDAWTLNGCNIYNEASKKSFDQIPDDKGVVTLGSNEYDPNSSSQKFNVGLSGQWMLNSTDLGMALANRQGETKFTNDKQSKILRFRWNARQIITNRGKPFNLDMSLAAEEFKFEEKPKNAMIPRDCAISKLIPLGLDDHLALENGKLKMSSSSESRWTFEYGDL